MGRLHAAFGISLPANAADAHEARKKHTTACGNILLSVQEFLHERSQSGSQMSLALVSSRAPSAPNSRPTPEPLTPPKGARGSDRTKSLMNTAPASICAATALAWAGIFTEHGRAQAELRIIGQPDRLFVGFESEEERNRTKELFTRNRRVVGQIDQHRRRIKITWSIERLAAGEHTRHLLPSHRTPGAPL